MYLTVNGQPTYCYTGGRAFNAALPTAVFIHGVLNDHSVWGLQTRYLAHHGWNVLAPDLPGHCKSAGEPPRSVEQAARFVADLLDAAGVSRTVVVGHSWGSLIGLELASSAPQRVSQLVMVGTAFPMQVSPSLLETSLHQPRMAIDMVNTFSHALLAPPPSTLGPGTWLYGSSRALMRRVLASQPSVNLLHTGFTACNDYQGGDAAMARAECAVLFILGRHDQMTPPKAAHNLIGKARDGRVVMLEAGHQLMGEAPEGVLAALTGFMQAPPAPR